MGQQWCPWMGLGKGSAIETENASILDDKVRLQTS